jgi:hypothetical protein
VNISISPEVDQALIDLMAECISIGRYGEGYESSLSADVKTVQTAIQAYGAACATQERERCAGICDDYLCATSCDELAFSRKYDTDDLLAVIRALD